MYERFTEKAIKVIMLAQEEVKLSGHNFIGSEMLLLGLIAEGTGVAAQTLQSSGVNLKAARIEVEKIIGKGSGYCSANIPFTPRAERVMKLAGDIASELDNAYIDTEHLLFGIIREGEGVAIRVLENLGVEFDKLGVPFELPNNIAHSSMRSEFNDKISKDLTISSSLSNNNTFFQKIKNFFRNL